MTNEDGRIVVTGLTKTYGTLRAVDDLIPYGGLGVKAVAGLA